jgi:hypothetical protein
VPELPLPVSMEAWLASIDFACYWDAFKQNGFDRFATLGDLDESAMSALGVALGHRKMLLRKAGEIVRRLPTK